MLISISFLEMNKKKGLPQWLRDALNKKEKEKQKKLETEKASKKDDEDSEDEIKTIPEEKVEARKGAAKKARRLVFCCYLIKMFCSGSVLICGKTTDMHSCGLKNLLFFSVKVFVIANPVKKLVIP